MIKAGDAHFTKQSFPFSSITSLSVNKITVNYYIFLLYCQLLWIGIQTRKYSVVTLFDTIVSVDLLLSW